MILAQIKKCCLVVLVLLLNMSFSYGQSTTGRFLLFTPSARSSGMGGVGVANDYSPYATYFNPSNLAFSPAFAAVGSFTRPFYFIDDVAHSYFSVSTNLNDFGAIGISANLYWEGNQIGDYRQEDLTDWQMKLTYAHSLNDKIAIGVGLGILKLALSDVGVGTEQGHGKTIAASADLGLAAKGFFPALTFLFDSSKEKTTYSSFGDTQDDRGISLGIALRNIGPKITMIDAAQADPIASTLSLGLSYSLVCGTPLRVLLASDLENRIYEGSLVDYIHWGGELRIYRILFYAQATIKTLSGKRILI